MPPPNESEAQRVNRALAEAAREAEERQADEFPREGEGVQLADPGGRGTVTAYGRFVVNDQLVDPSGEPIDQKKD